MRISINSLVGGMFVALTAGALGATAAAVNSQAHSALSASGNPKVQTPNLNQLAARGTRLEKAPSLITSRMSHLLVEHRGFLAKWIEQAKDTFVIPALLHEAGAQESRL